MVPGTQVGSSPTTVALWWVTKYHNIFKFKDDCGLNGTQMIGLNYIATELLVGL